MDYTQTLDTLSYFFADLMERYQEDIEKAIREIEKVKRNPYKRFGKRLHKEAKEDFIEYIYEQIPID